MENKWGDKVQDLLSLLDQSIDLSEGKAVILDPVRLRATIHRLAEVSALESGERRLLARYLTRLIALAYGVAPASINDLYLARGRGEVPPTFTVPAINLRALSFDAAQAVFRAARPLDAGAFIFEIARSEMGYTDQRPGEYVTNVLAAAVSENYTGPVFIQGDHFQASAKRYAADPETEVQALRELIREAISAGFYNIDIDASTLVDLSLPGEREQQALNSSLSAMFTALIRELEPEGVTISVGGEIGEVGKRNSRPEELRAYMDGYRAELDRLAPGVVGLSKISIQTGTSHGGVVLPDGTIQEVQVDFDTLRNLSRLAREEYGLGGAVQHGASTLPEAAFGKFVEAEAVEVHLATNFQNILFNLLPDNLREEIYTFLDERHAGDRKPDMTADQFYYKTRKNAIGPFKTKLWNLAPERKEEICAAWETQFARLFSLLGLAGTKEYVRQTVHAPEIVPSLRDYFGEAVAQEDTGDLAD